MKAFSFLTFCVIVVATAAASSLYDASLSSRHMHIANRSGKNLSKRCKSRPKQSNAGSNAASTSGLINVKSNCGPIGATESITATSGPNGNIKWLNCGISGGGGWKPPYITIPELITVDLASAVKDPNSPFQACQSFISLFEKYGNMNGIPPIMLASFAMQESSCDPSTVGGAGEQGLMQLTHDKCVNAPGGNCQDPNYNIKTGAAFIKSMLGEFGGSVLLVIGHYNGWSAGMTYGDATAAGDTSCCRCQNNLDYLHQFVNGWLQNIDSYSHNPPLGEYWNLKKCGNY